MKFMGINSLINGFNFKKATRKALPCLVSLSMALYSSGCKHTSVEINPSEITSSSQKGIPTRVSDISSETSHKINVIIPCEAKQGQKCIMITHIPQFHVESNIGLDVVGKRRVLESQESVYKFLYYISNLGEKPDVFVEGLTADNVDVIKEQILLHYKKGIMGGIDHIDDDNIVKKDIEKTCTVGGEIFAGALKAGCENKINVFPAENSLGTNIGMFIEEFVRSFYYGGVQDLRYIMREIGTKLEKKSDISEIKEDLKKFNEIKRNLIALLSLFHSGLNGMVEINKNEIFKDRKQFDRMEKDLVKILHFLQELEIDENKDITSQLDEITKKMKKIDIAKILKNIADFFILENRENIALKLISENEKIKDIVYLVYGKTHDLKNNVEEFNRNSKDLKLGLSIVEFNK